MAPKYDDKDEVLWFISVTQREDWTKENFDHEYHVVHAGMTKKVSEFDPSLKHYTQVTNLEFENREEDQPVCNCLTFLTWTNLQVVWDGMQTPGYKASAGKHVFARLDQVGTLVTVFDAFEGSAATGRAGQRIVVFHRKDSLGNKDDAHGSDEWLKQRAALVKTTFSDDPALASYRLLRDVVPKDVEFFFPDTLFDVGSWHRYMALEEIRVPDRKKAQEFVAKHKKFLEASFLISPAQVVIGDAIDVVR